MNIRFAIPTHRRHNLLNELTYKYLQGCGIPDINIDIFISDDADYLQYYETGLYNNCRFVLCDTKNVRDKFNFIHSYYPAGTNVVVIEDDIESVQILAGYNILEPVTKDLKEFCIHGFTLCHTHGTKLWGISSNNNPFFLKKQSGPCFKLIVANMYGFIAENPPLLITQHTKTDYERTILYTLKYGSVIRIDQLCPMTKNYKNPGGMQDQIELRAKMEEEAVNYLAKTYPDLCKTNETKSSKYKELTLATKRIKQNPSSQNLFGL